jgi:carboxymethylenebutenolidase
MRHDIVSEHLELPVDDEGRMGAYLARPVAPGRRPGVIVAFEMFGLTSYVRQVTDRIAELGYVAIAPDFYHRTAPGIELGSDPADRSRGLELLEQVTRPGALGDVRAAMAHLHGSVGTTPKTGMVGLSFGGHIAYFAATQLDLAATVAFYPGWLPTTDIALSRPEPTLSLTSGIAKHDGRLLLLVGEQDHVVPADQTRLIRAELEAAGVRHELVVYPDTPHGFACHQRDTFRPTAAQDAWRRVGALLLAELNG